MKRKQEVDARWIVEKRKLPRSGHLLLLCLFDQVIEGMREDTNRWAAEWFQLFRLSVLSVTTDIW